MPVYRQTWTVGEYGHDEENGERFLDGFMKAHPEVGPVVSQNMETGALSVTFSLDAPDINAAVRCGADVFAEGATASGLEATEVIDLTASLAIAETYDEDRELVPA